ncbi:MAG: ATP-binding protein [Treponema sp.]|nr:ATP-binding protein [Treponema sp.]
MIKFTSIKTRTTLYTLIPVVIGFMIICTVMFVSLFNSQRNTVRAEFHNIVKKHTGNFEKKINNTIDYLAFVSNILEFQIKEDSVDRELMQRMMLEIFERFPNVSSSSLYFEPNMYDGKDALYRNTEYGSSLSGRISYYYKRENNRTIYLPSSMENEIEFLLPYYTITKETGRPYYTDPVMYNIDGTEVLMCVIVFPIYGKNNEFIGAVTADIFLGDIYELLQAEKIYETGYMIIITGKNQILYSPRFEDIGKTSDETYLTFSFPENTEKTIIFHTRSIINNKRALTAVNTFFIPEIDSHFFISITAPVSEVNAFESRLVIIILFLSLAIIVLTAVFVFYLINKLTKPLQEFTSSADKLGNGDFSARITGYYDDEFSILKDTINLMAERIEENIEESKITLRVLQTVLNGIDAFIYVTIPATGEILFINERMKVMFGLKDDEGVGQYCYKLFRKDLDERCSFCPIFQLEKEPDKVVVWEEKVPEINRDIRHTDCFIDWPGGFKVHMQQAIDITDIKTITAEKIKAENEAHDLAQKKAQAEETSRMKSVFLASMSHEIRTPMHGIIGFSELALDDDLPQESKNYISKIKTSAESLLLIINDILDVSKIEAGKIELEKIPFDVGDVFKLCRLIASPNAEEKGLTLFCYAEPSVGKLLLGDPTRLRQILLNLLSNAIKFTNNGMVKLLAAVKENTQNGVTMHFEIKDSGIGMTDEQITRVFQPFMQADDSTTRKYGGTGLGLTITKSFIELMGGKLQVESSFGVGSKFCFDLTFETIDVTAAHSDLNISINRSEKPVFDGEILVCEDNELNKIVICDHLAKVGIKTVVADNGKIGVDIVKKYIESGHKPFNLIFMDIHMPEMDGLEASKKIIELGCRVPIIALTANVMQNDKELYFKSGIVDCLPKPFVTNDLWTCLLKYITPVSMINLNKDSDFSEEENQRMEIIKTFVKNNQTAFIKISEALEAGDIKLAHRLAHSLKGVAGLVGKYNLSKAASAVEQSLALGKADQLNDQMIILENELNSALTELSDIAEKFFGKNKKTIDENLSKEAALNLLKELDFLLESDSYDSLEMVKKISSIPGTDLLAEQVENMKFKQARETITKIIKQMDTQK